MSATNYIIDIALILVVLRQIKASPLTSRSVLLPIVILAIAGALSEGLSDQGQRPPHGYRPHRGRCRLRGDKRTHHQGLEELRRSDHVPSRLTAASVWILGMAIRMAFDIWANSHSGEKSLVTFSIHHSISSGQAYATAFVLMAFAQVLIRIGIIQFRRVSLSSKPADSTDSRHRRDLTFEWQAQFLTKTVDVEAEEKRLARRPGPIRIAEQCHKVLTPSRIGGGLPGVTPPRAGTCSSSHASSFWRISLLHDLGHLRGELGGVTIPRLQSRFPRHGGRGRPSSTAPAPQEPRNPRQQALQDVHHSAVAFGGVRLDDESVAVALKDAANDVFPIDGDVLRPTLGGLAGGSVELGTEGRTQRPPRMPRRGRHGVASDEVLAFSVGHDGRPHGDAQPLCDLSHSGFTIEELDQRVTLAQRDRQWDADDLILDPAGTTRSADRCRSEASGTLHVR